MWDTSLSQASKASSFSATIIWSNLLAFVHSFFGEGALLAQKKSRTKIGFTGERIANVLLRYLKETGCPDITLEKTQRLATKLIECNVFLRVKPRSALKKSDSVKKSKNPSSPVFGSRKMYLLSEEFLQTGEVDLHHLKTDLSINLDSSTDVKRSFSEAWSTAIQLQGFSRLSGRLSKAGSRCSSMTLPSCSPDLNESRDVGPRSSFGHTRTGMRPTSYGEHSFDADAISTTFGRSRSFISFRRSSLPRDFQLSEDPDLLATTNMDGEREATQVKLYSVQPGPVDSQFLDLLDMIDQEIEQFRCSLVRSSQSEPAVDMRGTLTQCTCIVSGSQHPHT